MNAIDDFRDDVINKLLDDYNLDKQEYNKKYESLPEQIPNFLKWFIAIYLVKTEQEFSMDVVKPILKVKYEW